VTVWIDAQLPPALVRFFRGELIVEARSIRDLGLEHANDLEIFLAARKNNAVILTKDADFSELSLRLGPPPQVVILKCGNTSNSRLRSLLAREWPSVMATLRLGTAVVEIIDT
jgi:predicted nuclease of predicted toxin-antitoxin system